MSLHRARAPSVPCARGVQASAQHAPLLAGHAVINAPSWCAEAWVAHGVFRNLGYPTDELFFGCVPMVGVGQAVVVQLQRKRREFTWTLVRVDGDPDEVERTWKEFATYMNTAGNAECRAVWDSSEIVRSGGPAYLAIAQALAAKGLDVPNLRPAEILWGPPKDAS